jgi:hypothetical protein
MSALNHGCTLVDHGCTMMPPNHDCAISYIITVALGFHHTLSMPEPCCLSSWVTPWLQPWEHRGCMMTEGVYMKVLFLNLQIVHAIF